MKGSRIGLSAVRDVSVFGHNHHDLQVPLKLTGILSVGNGILAGILQEFAS